MELTFPPCFSVSGFDGLQLQSLDLEASDRSAAHSLTAQWSKQRDVLMLHYHGFHKKGVIQIMQEKHRRTPNLFLVVLCLFWRKLPRSCGCVHRSRSWWGQRCRSSPGRWRGRRGSLCRRPWRRRSSPSGRDGSQLPWCCRRIPGHHRNLLPLLQCSAATRKMRCCCYCIKC